MVGFGFASPPPYKIVGLPAGWGERRSPNPTGGEAAFQGTTAPWLPTRVRPGAR